MERTDALRRVLFLRDLPEGALVAVAAAGYERRLAPGEVLFTEGDRCLGLIVVIKGAVKVCKVDGRGREVTLSVETPGRSVADLALFDNGNYPACAEAAATGAVVYIVSPDRFRDLARAHGEIAAGAVRALAVQQRKLIEMLKAQTLHTVRARLAAYLLHAAGHGDTLSFPLAETNAAIGSHVGTVREVVSRTLHALEDDGIITLRGRTVTVCDPAALRRLAEQRD